MAVRKINESTLTAIGNAIRSKTGGSALINPEDMASEIASISGGTISMDGGEFVLSSDLSNSNHFIAHNLRVVPDVIKWWVDSPSIPNINCLVAGYFTRTVAPNVKFPTTGVSNYLCGIWHSSTQNTNNYQQWDYTIRSPYINSVSKTGFNICASDYVIPANYTIKWIAYAFNE